MQQYNLPDFTIFSSEKKYDYHLWKPDKTYVVLGASNTEENAVNLEMINGHEIIVIKRNSGGQTVLLTPKTLVIAVAFTTFNYVNSRKAFAIINSQIIEGLKRCGIKGIQEKGISDLAINDKKILGSSIYHKRQRFFYHAVLNVSEDVDLIEKYLKPPEKEPDYRKGRSHKEFVTSILEQGFDVNVDVIKSALEAVLQQNFFEQQLLKL